MVMKLTAEQKIQRANVWIMKHEKFIGYSGIIMIGDVRIEDDKAKCPTAYTDGKNVVYGRDFIDGLTEEEIRFVVLHENLHKMYRHIMMWKHLFKQSPMLANVAADFIVNGTIEQVGCPDVKMPEICKQCYDPKYSDGSMDVGQVFRELLKKYPPQTVVVSGGSGKGKGQKQQGQGPVPGNGMPQGFDDHGWEEAESWSDKEQRELSEAIDSAIRQGAVLAGRMGGDLSREFGELMKVKTDYREIMRQFFQNACQGEGELSYRRPSRRMLQHDLIMPTEICETLPHVVIGIDTSGSIGGEILTNFMSNVAHMLRQVNPERIDLLYWDTKVAGHETYEQGEVDKLLSSTQPAGGGGTSPACVSRWLEKNKVNPTCLVMLTDGAVNGWPKEMCPTIWCLYENEGCVPPYGVVAHI